MYQSLANPSHPAHAAARGKDSIWRGVLCPALTVFVVLSAIVGLLYPLAVTGVARLLFPEQAAGSLIVRDGKVVGSRLIGQSFTRNQDVFGTCMRERAFPDRDRVNQPVGLDVCRQFAQ